MESPAPQYSEQMQLQAYMVFSSDDTKQMETLFSFLFSSQESQRSTAFNLLLCCKFHYPILLIAKLIFLLQRSPNTETRANSARLLSVVKAHYLWPKLPVDTQLKLKSQLILCLQIEDSMPVLRILCGVVSEIVCKIYKSRDHWEELFDLIGIFVSSENDKYLETAMLVFANIPSDCRRLISKALKRRFENLHSSVLRALGSQNVDVKVAAFGAVIGLLYLFPINNLILQMIIGVYDFLKDKNEDCAQKGLKLLLILITEEPQILNSGNCAHNILFFVLKIAESEIIRDETRNFSIQILMALLKAKDSKSAIKSLPLECMSRLLYVSMKMLIDTKDEIGWYEMENAENDNAGKTDSYIYGIKLLNQLPIVFGKTKILPIVLKGLPVYMDSRDWLRRHAGISLLGIISKDFSAEMVLMDGYLDRVLKMVLKAFTDEHPRVCWAAFNFMRMPTDTVGAIQILHHTRIAPALIDSLNRNNHTRVQEELVSALLFFVKSIPQDCLTTYLDLNVVLWKLLSLLKGGNTSTRCRTIGLCIFNFVVKEAGISSKICAGYVPFLVQVCTDKNLQLKKEANLGIRFVAELGGSHFKPFVNGCLLKLGDVIKHMDRSCQDGLKASDTIVTTLGTIYQFHRDIIKPFVFVPSWLRLLPIKTDLGEAKATHEQLCSMVERSAPDIFGPNCEYLYRTVFIFLEVIEGGHELAEEETIRRMKKLLRKIWVKLPQNLLSSIFFTLDEKKQQVLANDVFGTLDLNKTNT